ncbi:reverse transcriptase domain-containing protein [Tanacetum coccineum]
MTPIVEYLISGILPADKKIARKIRIKAQNYRIIDKILYKRSFLTPWLRPISIVAKVTTLGYYWPSMHKDATEIIQNCDTCKIHSPTSKLPKQDMTSVTMMWPFVTMGHPHSKPFAGSSWKGEILDNGNRLLHQLGGSKTFNKRHKEACREIHMGARHMPFGNTPNDSIRQQETVQRKSIPVTLRKAQNQASAHFYILPTGEQID